MRIFVYLLALLTGLSAAQSGEARHASPAALDVASAVWDAGEAETAREFTVSTACLSVAHPPLTEEIAAPTSNYRVPCKLQVVHRGDRAHE
jgi:cellobiose-specific phosphotransferase system component IIA